MSFAVSRSSWIHLVIPFVLLCLCIRGFRARRQWRPDGLGDRLERRGCLRRSSQAD